jgi:hypothetical protein
MKEKEPKAQKTRLHYSITPLLREIVNRFLDITHSGGG